MAQKSFLIRDYKCISLDTLIDLMFKFNSYFRSSFFDTLRNFPTHEAFTNLFTRYRHIFFYWVGHKTVYASKALTKQYICLRCTSKMISFSQLLSLWASLTNFGSSYFVRASVELSIFSLNNVTKIYQNYEKTSSNLFTFQNMLLWRVLD